MNKKVKRFMAIISTFAFVLVLSSGFSTKAAPAPGLTSLSILGFAIDDNNEIHVATKEIGTSHSGFVYCNGNMCKQNIYETEILWGSNNIAYGYIKYYHTGMYYSPSLSGKSYNVTANSSNAMQPWNTLSTSATVTLP